jgi:hypothetical protein
MKRRPRACTLFARGALLMSLTGSLGAQDSVSATSGDPRVIAAIRSRFANVERRLATYRVVDHDVSGFSTEGGTLRGYFDGSQLTKLKARIFGEIGRVTEEYYFEDAEPVFLYRVDEQYDRPLTGRVVRRDVTRSYLSRGRLVRRIHTRAGTSVVNEPAELKSADEIRREAKLLARCARATTPDPEECDAESAEPRP